MKTSRTLDNCVVEVAAPALLTELTEHFDARLVEQIARRRLAWVPDPLTAVERGARYPWRLSLCQAEFSDNTAIPPEPGQGVSPEHRGGSPDPPLRQAVSGWRVAHLIALP